jgi:hypothetical protein
MAGDERVVGGGRFNTNAEGFRAMLESAKAVPRRVVGFEG